MPTESKYVSVCDPAAITGAENDLSTGDLWLRAAQADFRLCHALAQRFNARLARSLRSQRVGWELFGHCHCALLLPDVLPAATSLAKQDWRLYNVVGETLFRQSAAERKRLEAIILAESVEDWAELLRQAVRGDVFDVRYEVTPHYLNPLGDLEYVPSGSVFTLEAYAPHAIRLPAFRVTATGATPAEAARTACRRWLAEKTL